MKKDGGRQIHVQRRGVVLLIALLAMATTMAWGATVSGSEGDVVYPEHVSRIVEDEVGSWRMIDGQRIPTDKAFDATGEPVLRAPVARTAVWNRIEFPASVSEPTSDRRLDFGWPHAWDWFEAESFEVYWVITDVGTGAVRLQRDTIADHGTLAAEQKGNFPFSVAVPRLEADERFVVLVRQLFATPFSAFTPRLIRDDALTHEYFLRLLAFGVFYGLVLSLILYNLVMLPQMRDICFLWLALEVMSESAFFIAQNGLLHHFLPDLPLIVSSRTALLSFGFICVFTGLLARDFLKTRRTTPWLDRALLAYIAFGALLLLLAPFPATHDIVQMILPVTAIGPFIGLLAIWTRWRQGMPSLGFFFLAWGLWAAGGVTTSLSYTDVIPFNPVTMLAFQICTAAAVIMFTVAISQRVGALRRQREAAEAGARTKSEFLARIAHELRTPLNSIIGFSEILLDQIVETPKRHMTATILRQSETLLKLINDLLDQSKIEAGRLDINPHPLDLRVLLNDIQSVGQARADEQGIRLEVDCPEDVPRLLMGDYLRLKQILMNLMGNAIKFTHQGSVTIRLRLTGLEPGAARIQMAVADTGIGIRKEKQAQVFDQYAQAEAGTARRYGGTGLGTAIARDLVRLMGGDIHLESEPGRGSVFSFEIRLPLCTGEELKACQQSEGEAIMDTIRSATILVAEDYEPNQAVVRAHLEAAGHRVTIVGNGQLALEAFRAGSYDLVLLDVQMPFMDGYEAAREIRRLENAPARIPIIALTANADLDAREKALQAGMDGVLAKPIRRSRLLREIQRWMLAREELRDLPVSSAPSVVSQDAQDDRDDQDAQNAQDVTQRTDESLALPIDTARLIHEFEGDRVLALDLLHTFLTQLPSQNKMILDCIDAKDWNELYRIAHKNKGAASNLAADRLARAAGDLENAAQTADPGACRTSAEIFQRAGTELADFARNIAK